MRVKSERGKLTMTAHRHSTSRLPEHLQYDLLYEPRLHYAREYVPQQHLDQYFANNLAFCLGSIVLRREDQLQYTLDGLA